MPTLLKTLVTLLYFILFADASIFHNHLYASTNTPHSTQSITDPKKQQLDSLSDVLATQKGIDRINTHYYIYRIVSTGNDSIAELKALNNYLEEANTQQNVSHEGLARSMKMMYFFNYNQQDSLLLQKNTHLDFLSKNQLWNFHYNAWLAVVNAYLHKGQFQSALRESKIIYEDALKRNGTYGLATACFAMGKAYQILKRPDEAIESLISSIEYLKKESDITLKIMVYRLLCSALVTEKRYKESLIQSAEWEQCLKTYQEQMESQGHMVNLSDAFLYVYLAQTTAYIGLSDLKNAEQSLQAARVCAEGRKTVSQYALKREEARLAELRGKYKQALYFASANYELLLKDNEPGLAYEMGEMKARLLRKAGYADSAALLYEQLLLRKDSLQNINFAAQLDDLQTIYNVDKLTEQQSHTRKQLLLAIICCILLIILVVSYLAHNKTLKKRNRILCRQIEAQTRAREELITLKESLHEIQINNQESDLFNRLEKLMKQHRLYAQTDLTRENLAEKLNTNRTYLTDAIKGKTGMSYSEYITELRLQNALMLFEKQPDLSITVVSEEVGYASYTSFYRAFSKRYGINPGEYHKFIQEQA